MEVAVEVTEDRPRHGRQPGNHSGRAQGVCRLGQEKLEVARVLVHTEHRQSAARAYGDHQVQAVMCEGQDIGSDASGGERRPEHRTQCRHCSVPGDPEHTDPVRVTVRDEVVAGWMQQAVDGVVESRRKGIQRHTSRHTAGGRVHPDLAGESVCAEQPAGAVRSVTSRKRSGIEGRAGQRGQDAGAGCHGGAGDEGVAVSACVDNAPIATECAGEGRRAARGERAARRHGRSGCGDDDAGEANVRASHDHRRAARMRGHTCPGSDIERDRAEG